MVESVICQQIFTPNRLDVWMTISDKLPTIDENIATLKKKNQKIITES